MKKKIYTQGQQSKKKKETGDLSNKPLNIYQVKNNFKYIIYQLQYMEQNSSTQ